MRARLIRTFRTRLEASLARSNIDMPWWIPASTKLAILVCTVVAVTQRSTPLPPVPVALAGLLANAPVLTWAITGVLVPPWLDAICVLGSVTVLLADPVSTDFSAVLLILIVAEAGAVARPALAFTIASASCGLLGAAQIWGRMSGYLVDIGGVVLAFAAGGVLRWYMRVLAAERGKQDAVREQAMLAERQRIAREVHDVVGHTLSITLLHLTGARRALQQDGDVAEAVEALTEAERVGRMAMSDIRRAVGLLASAPSDTRPLPGIDDLAKLVERTHDAGIDVRYEQEGDLAEVSTSAGLGLYRIAQESLGNIAKHAPDATALVRLVVNATGTRLTVRNSLSGPVRASALSGSGLSGMSARATQLGAELRAGPWAGHWVVDVTVPNGRPGSTATAAGPGVSETEGSALPDESGGVGAPMRKPRGLRRIRTVVS